ncbi:MAG TPA: polysaccharide deacetylase family protein [Prolixibacteraceae bacterium]|nr:polysaccharide deacetylase family protein [Prolixibacteraceae bacterium]
MTQHTKVLIFAPEITPRVEYTFEFIFRNILGAELIFTTKLDEFLQYEHTRINYSQTSHSSGLFLKAHSLLFEKNITIQDTTEFEYIDSRLFFPTSNDSFLPFDPFACTFYLLTRYEEYLSESTDKHERFTDSENSLVLNDLHLKPIVDQMAFLIAEKISEQFPEFKTGKRTFQFITTIDIDNAWAFKNKSLLISLGAVLKAATHWQWKELKTRLAVFLRLQKDPYDTYKYILETYKGHLNHILFFFLIGDRNKYDKNISYKNKVFRQLIGNLASVCEVGIHPSYASNEKPWMFEKEKDRLEDIIQKPVTKSRQHYLKLKIPKTYQNLIKSGITDDYTMGFASMAGFRAGTCTSFPFFDLVHNQQTELIIHPFQVMDVTLKDHMHLSPEKAFQLIEKLMIEVKKVNGTFISLWHNESLKDSDWCRVFEQILETGLNYENEQS